MSDTLDRRTRPHHSAAPRESVHPPDGASLLDAFGGYERARARLETLAGQLAQPDRLVAFVAEDLHLPFGLPFVSIGTAADGWEFLEDMRAYAATAAQEQGMTGAWQFYMGPAAVPFARQHLNDLVTALNPQLTSEQEAELRALVPPEAPRQGA